MTTANQSACPQPAIEAAVRFWADAMIRVGFPADQVTTVKNRLTEELDARVDFSELPETVPDIFLPMALVLSGVKFLPNPAPDFLLNLAFSEIGIADPRSALNESRCVRIYADRVVVCERFNPRDPGEQHIIWPRLN